MRIKRSFVPFSIEIENAGELDQLIATLKLLGKYEARYNASSFLTSHRDPTPEVKFANKLIYDLEH